MNCTAVLPEKTGIASLFRTSLSEEDQEFDTVRQKTFAAPLPISGGGQLVRRILKQAGMGGAPHKNRATP